MSGLAHITLPYAASTNSSNNEAWVLGGANGLIVAVDTVGSGHITTYPSDNPTVSFQIPFANDTIPDYRVLSSGPCHYSGSVGQESDALVGVASV